jgi:oligo-1,6-glucosidase
MSKPGAAMNNQDPSTHDAPPREWWKEAVVYQIYPRSFLDTNGDGVGDLDGVTARLDYLKALGVEVIWLGPHYDSPNIDNGYDIRDYRKIMPEFGDMADFDRMLAEIKQRGMRLVIDLVVNHTSDEHTWFVESRKSRYNRFRDFYIWRDGRGGGPPNNYPSFFGGSAWTKDETSGQYYLHYFARKQPDLNWENSKVREEVYALMRFWLDKGVSGFRMDVIPFISKQNDLPDLRPEQLANPEYVYASGPRLHQYLREMNREVLAPYGAMSVGEAFGVGFEQAALFTDARRKELGMVFHFDIVRLDRLGWRKTAWTLPALKAVYSQIDGAAGTHGWNASFLTNHDNPRAVSHFGDDRPQYRVASAKALALMMLTQRATPFLYQGDEIGMTNYPFGGIEDFDDIAAKGVWRALVESGAVDGAEYVAHLRETSRDNARTPMQWTDEPHGGFTTGNPWLPVNPNFREINAATQISNPSSVYSFHQQLLALRRRTKALIYGRYCDIDPRHPSVFAYTRTLEDDRLLALINVASQSTYYVVPGDNRIGSALLDNGAGEPFATGVAAGVLAPWHAAVYRLAL